MAKLPLLVRESLHFQHRKKTIQSFLQVVVAYIRQCPAEHAALFSHAPEGIADDLRIRPFNVKAPLLPIHQQQGDDPLQIQCQTDDQQNLKRTPVYFHGAAHCRDSYQAGQQRRYQRLFGCSPEQSCQLTKFVPHTPSVCHAPPHWRSKTSGSTRRPIAAPAGHLPTNFHSMIQECRMSVSLACSLHYSIGFLRHCL